MTPEIQSRISVLRQKSLDKTITIEEMREAIILMRSGRVGAAIASDTSRRKTAKKVVPSADDLLNELGEL